MPAPARESVAGDRLPRLAVTWGDTDLVGGVTTASLNFGRRTDAPSSDVDRAYERLGAWAWPRFRAIVGASQVHGARIFGADARVAALFDAGDRPYVLRLPGYDGFVTGTRGVLLTIGIADCVPALVTVPEAGVAALLHAGWRGVAADIVPRAIEQLGLRYGVHAAECRAWWGPAIGGCCYPVGPEVVEAVGATAAGRARDRWVREEGGRLHVDLRAALTVQAVAAGLPEDAITSSPTCTSCGGCAYHSYRRQRGGGGRMIAFAGFPFEHA